MYGAGKHPNVFRVECGCTTRRVLIGPAGAQALACVVCDRGVKDGVVTGPPSLASGGATEVSPVIRVWNVLGEEGK